MQQNEIKIENQTYSVYTLIQNLGLSLRTYKRKRNEGSTVEEAFQYCLLIKKKQLKRVEVPVVETAKKIGCSKKVIYNGLYEDKTIEQIKEEQKTKKEEKQEYLNYLYQIGLPKEYESLRDFCTSNGLNLSLIQKNIIQGMSLYDAVSNSFGKKSIITKYTYYGIQLKSIVQKYGLDYEQVTFWLRKGASILSALERTVFSCTFSKNMGGRSNYLWNMYQNDFKKGKALQNEIEPEEWMYFINSYAKFSSMQKDIAYYQFLNHFSIVAFKSLSVDERVQKVLTSKESASFTLNELYYILDFENGLMKDYTYLEEKDLWVYNGNREVLKQLKKSSR